MILASLMRQARAGEEAATTAAGAAGASWLATTAPEIPSAFSAEPVQERLGVVDKQFLGELVAVARSEIPVIVAQAALDLEEMAMATQAATECGERYLRTLHRLSENVETLLIDRMTASLPRARALVVPVAMTHHQLKESTRHVIGTFNREFANFTAAAAEAGFSEDGSCEL